MHNVPFECFEATKLQLGAFNFNPIVSPIFTYSVSTSQRGEEDCKNLKEPQRKNGNIPAASITHVNPKHISLTYFVYMHEISRAFQFGFPITILAQALSFQSWQWPGLALSFFESVDGTRHESWKTKTTAQTTKRVQTC